MLNSFECSELYLSMCHIGMHRLRAAHQVHLLAILSEDVAVLAGRGALRDEAHPAAIHALLQLPLDDLQLHVMEFDAMFMPAPVTCIR